ncbi:MAG: hypothetical protein JWQ09_1134 [Segetibacter sp.]|nr:hypothetical protein [Segetibacter sp.]
MISHAGETRTVEYKSGTYDRILITSYMVAAAANVPIVQADFNPLNVGVKVILRQNNKSYVIFQDNLLLLATFCTLQNGYHEFINGIDKVYAASGIKNVKLRCASLEFGGHIRVAPGDLLIVEVSPSQLNTFTSNIDANASYIEYDAIPSIGYKTGIPTTSFQVIQAGATKEQFNPGDNVTKIAFMNFDKNDLASEVVTNLSLMSDRYDLSLTFNQIQALKSSNYADRPASRYGTALPIVSTPTVSRGLDYLPQSFILFDGKRIDNELDQVRLDIGFNTGNVSPSNNYVGFRTYETDSATLAEAQQRQTKHIQEYMKKVAESSTVVKK